MRALHSAEYSRFAKYGEKKVGQHGRRLLSMLLCLCMVVSMMCSAGIMTAFSVESGPTANIVSGSRVADPDTMDDYRNRLLTGTSGSRYAGRVWTDKTVFAFGNGITSDHFDGSDKIHLSMLTDGYDGDVLFDADFAHVFSTLASSQVVNEAVTSPLDLVILLDMSGSMGADIHQGEEGHGYWETIGSNVGHIVTFPVEHINYNLWGDTTYPLRIYTSSYTADNTSTYWTSVKAVKSDENENEYIVNEIYPYNTSKTRITLNSNEILISAFHDDDRANLSKIAVNDTLTLSGINVSAGTITGSASVSVDRKEIKRWHQDKHTDMDERISHSRIASVLDSINTAIDALMEMNETNRVTVVGYGGTAATILPLGHYQKRDGQNYLSATDFTDYGSSTKKDKDFTNSSAYTVNSHANMVTIENGKITATEPIDKKIRNDYSADGTTGTTLIGFHTNLQAGIYEGFNNLYETLENIDDVTYTYHSSMTGKENVVPRIPVAFVMSDGGSNYAVKAPTEAKGGNGNEWYDLTVPGSLSGDWNAYDDTASKKYRAEQANAAGGDAVILDILLTASYMKSKIQNKYTELLHTAGLLKDGEKSDFEIHTVSVDTPTDDYQVPRVYAGLDPQDFFKNDTDLKAVAGIATDPNTWKYKSSVTSAYEHFNEWKTSGTTITFGDTETREGVSTTVNVKYNKLPDDHVGVTNEDVVNNILYNDSFADIGAADLTETFRNLIARFDVPVFTPISGDNDAGVSDSITYQDPLGEYMEIKNESIQAKTHHIDEGATGEGILQTYDMALLVFGEMHGLVRAGVYDWNWNDKWMELYHEEDKGSVAFTQGWYKGTPEEAGPTPLGSAYLHTDDSGTWPQQDPKTGKTYESAQEARDDGWVMRFNFSTLLSFVPITGVEDSNVHPEDLPAQVKNTVYTCYRFAGSQEDRNKLHRNPIYGDVPADLKAKWDAAYDGKQYPVEDTIYADTPGVYRLSDIRVWVEDTGDFTDTTGAITPNTGYDRSLYVNIPAAAVPTELATITLGKDGVTAYQTNLGSDHPHGTDPDDDTKRVTYEEYCYQSTPFRLFYAVGLEDDLILRDALGNQVGVDLNAVSPEYIQAHTAENGNVWFISNYYSGTRYSGYSTDDTSRTRGDPTVTFSPGIDNRYYVFQKPLPLYAHAYRVSTDYAGAVDYYNPEVKDFTWTKGESEGLHNGMTTWENYNGVQQSASSWVGGQFMGVYKTREDFYNAYRAWRENDSPDAKIEDSHGNLYEVVDGGIIFSEEDLLNHVTTDEDGNAVSGSHPFDSSDYYFILLEFYVPVPGTDGYDKDGNKIDGATGGKFVQWALARKGSEFGSGYASSNISNGDMLCWTDMKGEIDTNFAYMSTSDTGDRTRGEPTWEKLTYDSDALRTYLKDKCGISEDKTIPNPEYVDDETTPEVPKELKVLDEQVKYWLERQNDPQVKAALAAADTNSDGEISQEEFNTYFQFALAARPGGNRSGDMSNNLQYKGTYDAGTGYYDENNTKTSNTYYLPTISNNSGTDNNVIINNFLGNNGRLEIANQTLHVTKMIEPPDGFTLTDAQKEEVFNYQVSIQGVTGTRTAVKTEYNEYAETWERELGYIDVLTDNSDLVQTNDSTRALFVKVEGTTSIGTNSVMAKQVLFDEATNAYYYATENGTLPTDAEGNPDINQKVPEETVGVNGENLYYMYLPSNGTTGTSTEHIHRLYQAEDYDGTDKITDDLGRNGITTFVREGDTITPSEPGAENRVSQRKEDDTHPAGTKTYWNLDAELIPKSEVDAVEAADLLAGSPGEPGGIATMALESTGGGTWTHEGSAHSDHNALTYHDFFVRRPIEGTSESAFTSPYKSRTQYLTVTLNFGYNANANDGSDDAESALTPTDLYDPHTFGTVTDTTRLCQITAEFTLKHGEGLMFSGLSGSQYRFTEKLTEGQKNVGYTLKEVTQVQQNSTEKYPGSHERFADTGGVYSVDGDTGDSEEQVNYINTIDPELFVLTKGLEDVDGNPVAVPPEQQFTFTVTFTPKADAAMTDVDNTLHYWKGNKDTWKSTEVWTDPADGNTYKMPADAPKLDEYESYLSGSEYRLATIEPDVGAPGRTYTVTLKANEAIVFYGLIAGTDFTVKETKNDRYPVVEDSGATEGGYTKTGEIKRASADLTEIDPQKTHNRADFTNLMQSGVLTVEKYIHDDDRWSVTESFEFTVTLTAKDGESLDSSLLSVTKIRTTEEGEETSEPLTVTWNETKDGDKVTVLTATFALKHGERIVINGIPYNTDYTVAESDSAGYHLEHVADNSGDDPDSDGNYLPLEREDNSVSGTVTQDHNAVYLFFNNAKPSDLPFSGSGGVGLFYLLGAAFIVSGILFMNFYRKRRIRVK